MCACIANIHSKQILIKIYMMVENLSEKYSSHVFSKIYLLKSNSIFIEIYIVYDQNPKKIWIAIRITRSDRGSRSGSSTFLSKLLLFSFLVDFNHREILQSYRIFA